MAEDSNEYLGSSDGSSDDDWDFGGSDETILTECEHCGEVRRCHRTTDPYMREIHPEEPNESSYWCYRCWDSRHGDI